MSTGHVLKAHLIRLAVGVVLLSAVVIEAGGVSGSSLIFQGFYWEAPVPTTKRPLVTLSQAQAEQIRKVAAPYLATLSPQGWGLGVPERTLVLEPEGLRIVYGGNMGDEFGVTGARKGFFRSAALLTFLKEVEAASVTAKRSGTTPQ